MKAIFNPTQKVTTREDISRLIDELRALRIKHAGLVAKWEEAKQATDAKYAALTADLTKEILVLDAAISRWAVDNRVKEFGENKSLHFPSGIISFRFAKAKLAFAFGWNDEKVVAALKRLKLGKFIRTKLEVNRQAILSALSDPKAKKLNPRAFGLVLEQPENVSIETTPTPTPAR